MLAVNNSKNPVHDEKSSAQHSKVGEEAGSCCNHSKNPGGVEGAVAMMCSFFDELPSGVALRVSGPFFFCPPAGGVLPPPVGPSPRGGLLQLQQRTPPHFFPRL